jgi:hypothetical protein
MTTLPLALKLWYNPSGANRSCSTPLHRTATPSLQTASSRRKPCDPARVRRHRSFSARPDPVSARRAFGLGFVAHPSNRTVFWWTAANPTCRLRSWAATLHRLRSTTSSCFSCHHAARTWPCWPPGPSSHAYLSLHSSEVPQGIDLSRSLFTCTNTNQDNLHPQYSAKSQSTPRCQSLITTRSDHPPVLGHSGPHGAASPPRARRAGMAAPSRARWAGAAAPSQAHLAGPAAPSRAHQAGAAAPSPSPASWMARLTMPCARLRKKKLLDSLLGDRRRWCWGFLSVVVDEVLGRPGFILTRRRTVRQPVTRLGTCVRSGELLATKRIMWSQGDMWLFIFYSKYQMPNYSYELFDS